MTLANILFYVFFCIDLKQYMINKWYQVEWFHAPQFVCSGARGYCLVFATYLSPPDSVQHLLIIALKMETPRHQKINTITLLRYFHDK